MVTASHSPKTLKDAPVVTRLITSHDIKITDATNIQDLLIQEIPGLEFGFAMSQETSLNMSGFGGNAVLFLVDGERMAGETMDNVDYNRMNLDNVGRIEIVKGASSALYGSNAVGGVVNIISRENLEPWTANVNSRYNTFGHEWRNGASFSFNTAKWNSQTSFQHTSIDPVNLPKAHSSEEVALELLKKAQGLALRRIGTEGRLQPEPPLRTEDLQREGAADVACHRPADADWPGRLFLPHQRARHPRLPLQRLQRRTEGQVRLEPRPPSGTVVCL